MSCETHDKCDSRCQMATGEKCACVCGGMNHGTVYLGSEVAKERYKQFLEMEMEEVV